MLAVPSGHSAGPLSSAPVPPPLLADAHSSGRQCQQVPAHLPAPHPPPGAPPSPASPGPSCIIPSPSKVQSLLSPDTPPCSQQCYSQKPNPETNDPVSVHRELNNTACPHGEYYSAFKKGGESWPGRAPAGPGETSSPLPLPAHPSGLCTLGLISAWLVPGEAGRPQGASQHPPSS